jgi:ribonuclease BN (tRNA processing enzyme)
MSVRLTVLGSCGAWPEPGRACSGFLVEHDGYRVAIDLGFGTMPRLGAHGPPDAVVITHEHPDHCADLNALYRQRLFTKAPRSAAR